MRGCAGAWVRVCEQMRRLVLERLQDPDYLNRFISALSVAQVQRPPITTHTCDHAPHTHTDHGARAPPPLPPPSTPHPPHTHKPHLYSAGRLYFTIYAA